MFFGITDIWVFIAYALCLVFASVCVLYGALNWNSPEDEAPSVDAASPSEPNTCDRSL